MILTSTAFDTRTVTVGRMDRQTDGR